MAEKTNLRTKTAMVIDFGLFVEIAITISKDFKKVYYHNPSWKGGFPKMNSYNIGYGIKEIELCHDMWDIYDEIDIFIFPDIYNGDLQLYLQKQGKLVFGGRKGEDGELYRQDYKDHMADLGLPVGKYEVVTGVDDLRKYLKTHKEVWVKQNITRGDFETFFSPYYEFVMPKLDEIEHILGANKFIKEFVIEENLPDKVEIGYDGFCVDGQYPVRCITGIEVKDLGYIGVAKEYKDLPKEITDWNKKMAPTFKKWGYRGFMSTELRIGKDRKPYMIDLCARGGSPPNEIYQNMYTNLADIMWNAAQGIMIEPIIAGKFGVEAMIHSSWADKNWQQIDFPDKYRENIKIRNLCIINGEYYAAPQAVGLPEIGAVVAHGNTLKEATEKVKEISEQVKGYYLEVHINSIDKGLEEFRKLEEYGIKIL